jgi:Ca2+-dependent lipid-binding protein
LRGSLDVLSLPLLNTYVYKAVESVIANFVLPRNYGLDIRKVLLGGDVAISASCPSVRSSQLQMR